MRRFQKLLSLLLCLALIAGVLAAAPLTTYADSADTQPYTVKGNCGVDNNSDVEWYAFDDKSMVVFGTGAMRDYELVNGVSDAPWYGDNLDIIGETLFATKIAIEYGITRIGNYSFYLRDNYPYKFYVQLNNIDISNTVTSIGKYAFYNQQIQQVIIPPSVTHIGVNAFKNCPLTKLSYYGDPDELAWDTEGGSDNEFPNGITCHILERYADKVNDLNNRFAYKNITFSATEKDLYSQAGEDVDRNIALYYSTASTRVFGGAAPYVIVGRFAGKKKSVTYGSNGFASCVKIGNEYYVLTDTATGRLNKAIIASNGRITGYGAEHPSLVLHLRHEYIGTNTVKVIYRLENKNVMGAQPLSDFAVGGTGDIKIGADDFASIEPLNQDGKQIGFYMKSGKGFDMSGDDSATLGFIGRKVEKTKANGSDPATYYDDTNAHFFYGKVDANTTGSAAGAKTVVMMPQRIFDMNTAASIDSGRSQDSGEFKGTDGTTKRDSGMSYYWDEISLGVGDSVEYAVLFSVYGTSDDASAQTVIKDINETEYYTVTFKNLDNSTLFKQVVKENDRPVYGGATPTKARYLDKNYTFSGWTDGTNTFGKDADLPAVTAETGDVTYTATFTQSQNQLFHEHALTLRGDIGVIFFLDVTPEEVDKGVTVKFKWRTNESIPERSSEYTISQDDYDSSTLQYKAKGWVAAAEMTYNIHAVAWFEGHEYTRETNDYSVREYGEYILDNSNDQRLVALAEDMLNYGAKAQLAFNRKTTDLADGKLPDRNYSRENVTTEMIDNVTEEENITSDVSDLGLTYWGSSIIYLTKTTLRHYYTVKDYSKFTDSVKNSANFNYGSKDGGIYFDVSDIPAAELHLNQDFKITDVNGVEHTYSYSPLHYCKTVLLMQDEEEVTQYDVDLAKATYWYNRSALAYFNSVNS